ncbi:MAG: D-alanine--D-alanine ligase [Fluviicola sp.]|jgi:D-alanine-D-alanine ligase|uniref:D-alanine--D-alanine ligase n=1 Tax=Fluviicola sp. TaxID=1917219 RepID=UPI002610426F|nr:D-alanine--D-alanine ligase [Fluviicola sp.]MDF3028684.1 D-alanine--D-alanine ligase [Fluviicola sp.]
MKLVGLFCGGYSSEFEISLKSAQTIMENFPKGYEVVPIQVLESGWFVPENSEKLPFSIENMSYSTKGKERKIDIGLVYIHGNPGENGKIQALLDMKGIPYVNSNALASELSFDKWYCNQFLSRFGIPVAKSLFLKSRNEFTAQEILGELGLPCFVKPSDSGSSFGISKVSKAEDLETALDKAFDEGDTVVIESFLKGTEVTCGIYRSPSGLVTLPLTEIVTENDFFDYEAKYLGQSQEITPARIPDTIRNGVWEVSKEVYSLLQLKSIARIDFMIVNDVPHVIEVNTTPGFSAASLVPQMLAEAGISITDFWTQIFEMELAKTK